MSLSEKIKNALDPNRESCKRESLDKIKVELKKLADLGYMYKLVFVMKEHSDGVIGRH